MLEKHKYTNEKLQEKLKNERREAEQYKKKMAKAECNQ